MKRSSPLVGLSREHHEALVLARRAAGTPATSETAPGQREHLLRRWDEQFAPHFAIEETVLLPESIETLRIFRGGIQSSRSHQSFSDYRRFVTGARIVK